MIDSIISDQVFKDALEVALKVQGKKKKEIIDIINQYSINSVNDRNDILDMEETNARQHQAEKKASKKVCSEFEEQAALVHWFRKTYPDVWIYANRNGGTRTPREKIDQIREGVLAGVADLFVPGFMLYVEMKRTKGGVTSDTQIAFKEHVESFGYTWILGEGFYDAKAKILEFVEKRINKT
jgi:hypothetical protein